MRIRSYFGRRDISLRHSIFIRLFTTFLLIMIPIFLLCFYIYNWSVQTASENISKTAESQVSAYLRDLESEIERMKLLLYDSINDVYLNKLAFAWETMGNIERTESINLIRDRLFTIKNSSLYIKNATAHIPSIGKSISAEDGAYNFDKERYISIRTEFGHGARLIVWRDRLHISASKLSGKKGAEPLFIVEIELDSARLKEALSQFNAYSGSGSFLVEKNSNFIVQNGSLIGSRADMNMIARKLGEKEGSGSTTTEVGGLNYYFAWASSGDLGISIYKYIPEQTILQPINRFYIWAWIFVFGAIGIIIVYALSTYKFIHKPLLTLVQSFRRMENGDFNLSIEHAHNDEFRYLYNRFNYLVVYLRNLIDQVYKQKIMTQRAELKQLQSQINPHFLYNSFFILNTMARTGDVESVEQFTRQLGEYFQFITRNASDEIPLQQEIHHARVYTNIQALRFSRRIRVQFDPLPEGIEHIMVPRLIVQPIIENGFEHSLEKMVDGGLLVVRFETGNEEIQIIVEDNGDSLSDSELLQLSHALQEPGGDMEITGLINIHRRLVLKFGETGGLRVLRSSVGGLRAEIRIPAERGSSHV